MGLLLPYVITPAALIVSAGGFLAYTLARSPEHARWGALLALIGAVTFGATALAQVVL